MASLQDVSQTHASFLAELLGQYPTPALMRLVAHLQVVEPKSQVRADVVATLVDQFQHREVTREKAHDDEEAYLRKVLSGLMQQLPPQGDTPLWLTSGDLISPKLQPHLSQYRIQRVLEFTQTCELLAQENLKTAYELSQFPWTQKFITEVQQRWFRELTLSYQKMCDELGVALCSDTSALGNLQNSTPDKHHVVGLCRVLRVVLGSGTDRLRRRIQEWGMGTTWTVAQRLAAWSVFHPHQISLITSLFTKHHAAVRRSVEDFAVWELLPRVTSTEQVKAELMKSLSSFDVYSLVPGGSDSIRARSMSFAQSLPTKPALHARFAAINTSTLQRAFAHTVKSRKKSAYIKNLLVDPYKVVSRLPKVKAQLAILSQSGASQ